MNATADEADSAIGEVRCQDSVQLCPDDMEASEGIFRNVIDVSIYIRREVVDVGVYRDHFDSTGIAGSKAVDIEVLQGCEGS
ncbi:hypothetical protein CWE02_09450 [Brucella pituitosa]|nr:hypothetical protein CWE02_09450 [Brucella pituitosa]